MHKPEGIFKGPGSARVIHGCALDPGKNLCMGYNFIPVDRDQLYLLPPSIKDWLPEDHVAFFVLDVVEEIDLTGIYSDYRPDGWGAAAHEPAMMTALLVYAYCVGVRSSRQIERACHFDVRHRHRPRSGGISVGWSSFVSRGSSVVQGLDGTKMATDASRGANRSKAYIDAEVEKILADAARIDAEEDARFGPDNRGDEPPAALRSREERRRRFAQAKARLEAEEATAQAEYEALLARRAATEAELGRKLRGRRPVRRPHRAVRLRHEHARRRCCPRRRPMRASISSDYDVVRNHSIARPITSASRILTPLQSS